MRTQEHFVSFLRELVASLDRALAAPEPPPYVDERGGWTNWPNRWSFWEAMIGWLDDTGHMDELQSEPISGMLLETVDEPDQDSWYDADGLREYLHSVESWAAAQPPDVGSPDMWSRAARALIAGAVYE